MAFSFAPLGPFGPLQLSIRAYFMYSPYRLWYGYSGNAYRLTRTSDSAFLDFTVNSTTAQVNAWLAGSAYTVPTVYDQSGFGRDVTSTGLQLDLTRDMPTFKTDGVGIDFSMANCLAFTANRTDMTVGIFARMQAIFAAASNTLIAFSNEAATNQNRLALGVSTTGVWQVSGRRVTGESTGTLNSATSAEIVNFHRLFSIANYRTGQFTLGLDGVVTTGATTSAGNAVSSNGLGATAGNNAANSSPASMEFSALVGYQNALSTTAQTLLDAALLNSSPPLDILITPTAWASDIVVGG